MKNEKRSERGLLRRVRKVGRSKTVPMQLVSRRRHSTIGTETKNGRKKTAGVQMTRGQNEHSSHAYGIPNRTWSGCPRLRRRSERLPHTSEHDGARVYRDRL